MFFIFLIIALIKPELALFNKNYLVFNSIRENINKAVSIETAYNKNITKKDQNSSSSNDKSSTFLNISYFTNIFSSYFVNFEINNLDKPKVNNSFNSYTFSFLKGFYENNLFGIFAINYSYINFYKNNSFLSLSMQTGKYWNSYCLSLSYIYHASLNSYLNDRFNLIFENIYFFNKLISAKLFLKYYTLFNKDINIFEYNNSFTSSNLGIGSAFTYRFRKIKLDLYGELVFNKNFEINNIKSKNNDLLFGLRAAYSI
jgi:hypothetical protein